jgi:trimeric autotransporter adhesin
VTMGPGGGNDMLASRLVGIGYLTLASNTTGHQNTAVGYGALFSNTTGFENVAVGTDALGSNTVGELQVAVGAAALASNTTGFGNVALGAATLYTNTSGIHNTALGLSVLNKNLTGSHNTYGGRDAGYSNTTGNWNTGFGVDANPGCETGSGNTAIGGEAGYTENLAHQNVTGSNNVWVGYQSGPASATPMNNSIGIGYRSQPTQSDQAVFGNPSITETKLFGNVILDDTLSLAVWPLPGLENTAAFEVPNDATTAITMAAGLFYLSESTAGGRSALVSVNTASEGVHIVWQASTLFTTVANSSPKINVYVSGGTVVIQNKTGATATFRITTIFHA